MIIRYIIHFSRGECRCFSDNDLAVNIKFALSQGLDIVGVERK